MRFWQKHLFLTEAHKDIFLSPPPPFFVCSHNVYANNAAVATSLPPFSNWAPAAIIPSQRTAHLNLPNKCAFASYIYIRSEKSLQPNPCCDG